MTRDGCDTKSPEILSNERQIMFRDVKEMWVKQDGKEERANSSDQRDKDSGRKVLGFWGRSEIRGIRRNLPKGSWDERRRRIMEEGATGGQPREIGTDGMWMTNI